MSSPAYPSYYETAFSVVGRDSDCFSQCQAAALLSYLQETGLLAMADAGLTRKYLLERYHAIWMLARTCYTLEAPIALGDVIAIRSRSRNAHGMGIYREYEIMRENARIGEALALWMLVDAESRTLFPANRVSELSDILGDVRRAKQLRRLVLPDTLVPVHQRVIEYSQIDMNGHLNNSRYADLICDVIGLEKMGGAYVSSMHISYLSECMPGCTLTMFAQNQGGLWYVRGVGEDQIPRFEAAAMLKHP